MAGTEVKNSVAAAAMVDATDQPIAARSSTALHVRHGLDGRQKGVSRCLVAVGLTDDEIAKQLRIPKHRVLNQIARLLAKLGIRDRVEIVLYAYSDPAMYHRITTEIPNKTTKTPQGQTPQEKQKAG